MPKIVKISLHSSFGIPLRRHREEKVSLASCGKTTALAVNLGLFQFTGVSGLCLQKSGSCFRDVGRICHRGRSSAPSIPRL